MFSSIKELFSLLTQQQRRHIIIMQIMVILVAFVEMVGIASIGPFMVVVGNTSILEGDNMLAQAYQLSGLTQPHKFIVWLGFTVLGLLTLSTIFSTFSLYFLIVFGNNLGKDISVRLYSYYMYRPWLFHADGSSSALRLKIQMNGTMVIYGIIQPLMIVNSKIILACFITAGIFIFNPVIAIIGICIFGTTYFMLFRSVRDRLHSNGAIESIEYIKINKYIAESFGGIKDVLLMGRQQSFIGSYLRSSEILVVSHGSTQILQQLPRYIIELMAIGSVIFLVIYLVISNNGELGEVLPVLAIYALAGFKLLPAFQTIYSNVAQIRSNLPSYELLRDDLINSQVQDKITKGLDQNNEYLHAKEFISLKDVSFSYPSRKEEALVNLSFEIPVNKSIGIVGATGSGKSTVIDIVMGLIQPDRGNIYIDNQPLKPEKIRAWQNTLGFVPQNIFLADTTIRENIAFGIPEDKIDDYRVKEVIKLAHMDQFINDLPENFNTKVGEWGMQLSGGQRQRIGIARALYDDADVLILDEATSALDGITEQYIMEAIQDFSGSKTIIMIAHRLTTVQKCDLIFFMEKGAIIDQGTYDELLVRNPTFKKMASGT